MKKAIIFLLIPAIFLPCLTGCFSRKKWDLSIPVYKGGKLSQAKYNIGDGLTYNTDALGGNMYIISDTNKKEFNKYIKQLLKKGYTETGYNEINGNIFVQYRKDDKLLYAYYVDAYKEVRVIEDFVSVPENEFEYSYTPQEGDVTTIYQYGLMTDPAGGGSGTFCDGKYLNAGMFYIIRLADNSLILIDGGADYQVSEEGANELVDFMYEITGQSKSEKIRISNLIFSHAHGDHQEYIRLLLKYHSSKLNIERAMYNFPAYSILQGDYRFFETCQLLHDAFPNIKFIKPHTGQKLQLADIQMEIAFTHEDLVSAETGLTQVMDYNCTSTVIKFTINGKTLMMLGDAGGQWDMAREDYFIFEERFLKMYQNDIIDFDEKTFVMCDIVQVAHHGINFYMGNIYNAIEPEYALFPQADCKNSQFYHGCYRDVLLQLALAGVSQSKTYFMSRYTHAMTIARDGTITVEKSPIRGTDPGYEDYLAAFEPYN